MTISAPSRPKIPIYVGRDADGKITNHIIMAKTKTEERHQNEAQKSPKKKNSVRYPFYFVEKNYNKKSLEGKFQNKIQTAVSGTESTVKTDTEKKTENSFRAQYFRSNEERKKGPAINTNGEINPKNRHCLRGLDGKYGRWDEILRNILNGKLKIVQNRKATDTNTDMMMMSRKKSGHQKHTTLPSVTEVMHPSGYIRKRMHYKSTQTVR